MLLNRRTFTSSLFGAALGTQLPSRVLARSPDIPSAIAAIRAFGEADLVFNNLPGMTLGIVTPDGRRTVMNFGYANVDRQTPIGPQTLFQIGSITKAMVATIVHQLVAAGRLQLSNRVSTLLPSVPLPSGNGIELQHLLDHVAGLADDPPLFAAGGLWTAYDP
ncbi:MAG TPA: serine hydrolase domain-containing protein, partial [Sphingomicrobium sp.]|nr:serine hydrolase domain-containing protein [Sphingomicrobium sp.]